MWTRAGGTSWPLWAGRGPGGAGATGIWGAAQPARATQVDPPLFLQQEGCTKEAGVGGPAEAPGLPGLHPLSLCLLIYEMGVLAGRISWSIMCSACGPPAVLPVCPAGERCPPVLLQLSGRTEGEWCALLRPRLLAPEATRGLGLTCWNANKFEVVLQSVFPLSLPALLFFLLF